MVARNRLPTIGTSELAERLYERWRARQDFVSPLVTEEWERRISISVIHHIVRPRPKWEQLDSVQQGVWRAVAEEAAHVLVEATGAA